MTKTTENNAPAIKLIVGTDNIAKAITSITSRGKKLDHDIHVTAISAMAHHAEHGDVTLVNKLVDGMPKGSRVNALREFILANGKVTFDDKAQVFKHDKEGAFDLEGACVKSWTEYKPEQQYIPFDAAKAIKAILTKMDNVDPDKGDKLSPAQATAFRKMASELGLVD